MEHLDSDTTVSGRVFYPWPRLIDDVIILTQGWSVDDMFQVNKEKFAVNSTYDADMVEYT